MKPLAILASAFLLVTAHAQAQIFISFGNYGLSNDSEHPVLVPVPDPAVPSYYNMVAMAPQYNSSTEFTNLLTATGTSTGINVSAVTQGPTGFGYTSDSLGNEVLTGAADAAFDFQGETNNNIGNHGFSIQSDLSTVATLSFTGLTANATYTFTVYGANYNADGQTTENLNTTYTAVGATTVSGSMDVDKNNSNVVVLTVQADSLGDVNLETTAGPGNADPSSSAINAVRIDEAAPEPSTVALLLGGFGALLLVTARRRSIQLSR